jgi:MGT family glycosyltransferase
MGTKARRFLFVMLEGGGNVPPQLGVARRLRARGHQVRVLGDPAIEAEVRAAGCEHAPFRAAPHHNLRSREHDLVRDWAIKSPMKQFKHLGEQLLFGPAERYARDTVEEAERFQPDALVLDWMLLGAFVAAEKLALPTAALMHTPYALPSPGATPLGLGFRPARGALGRLRDRFMFWMQRRMFDGAGLAPLNGARASFGLAPLAHALDQMYTPTRILVLTCRAFDFAPATLPPNARYVGAQLDDPTWVEPWRAPWPESNRAPLVVVGLGSTFQDQRDTTARVIAALGALPVRGLVTLGGVFAPDELPAAPNVAVVRSAPHAAVLPEARAVVTHGGHGTVIKSLAHGVPLVCLPLGRDQRDNAARVVERGCGLTLDRDAPVETIRRAIARVLDEPPFAEAARRLQAAIAEDARSTAIVDELEALAAARSADRSRAVA